MRPTRWLALPPVLFGLAVAALPASAEVVRVEVLRREVILGGRAFGPAGAYEKLVGRIFFAFDPENPRNAAIVDLDRATVNGAGKVEAWADFMVLQPVDPARRRGLAWVEVSNRGRKASLRYFQRASVSSADPGSEEEFGDGLLMEMGLTLIWVGWQYDVPDRPGLLRLRVPIARGEDGPITGLVRADWVVDEPTEVLPLGHRGHRAYPPVDADDPANVLTVRSGRAAPRDTVSRDAWRFVPRAAAGTAETGPRLTAIRLEGGFEPGRIYELVYRARNPRVVGLGLAAIRDVLSYAKYDLDSEFPVSRGIAFGVSQTGRFLRHFLYQGFNVDEGDRKVYDGMLIHTAGAGRGSFNHRFAQPSRDAHRYSAFFYPTDVFPFTSRVQRDPVTGMEDGLLAGAEDEDLPLVFYTNTGYEYWGRAASLIHTSVDGRQDFPPRSNERVYHLAGGQHSVGAFPPSEESRIDETRAFVGNPLDFLLTLRALGVALIEWVDAGREPPLSSFPRVADGTLVPPEGLAFPGIPGVRAPGVIHVAYRADYGPDFRSRGIITKQPPELGPEFPSQVSQVDGLGNEVAGLHALELRVPLATYAPWSLRRGAPAATDELRDFTGTFAPLPRTPEEAGESGDTRPSVKVLYGSEEGYMERVRTAVRSLVEDRLLLPRDLSSAIARAEALWAFVMERP